MQAKDKQQHTEAVRIRVTPEEKSSIDEQARICGLTTSEYIRRRIFGNRVYPRLPITDEKTISVLKQLGGQIKQLFKYDLANPTKTLQLFNEIQATLKYIRNNNCSDNDM